MNNGEAGPREFEGRSHPGRHEPRPSLVISTSTLPIREGDGTARFVLDLAKSLGDRFNVTVIAPHAPGAELEQHMEGVRVSRFRYFYPARLQRLAYGGGMAANLRTNWLARIQVPFLLTAQTFSLWKAVRRTGARIVNTHWMVPQGLTASLLRRFLPIRQILHVHAADVYLLQRVPFGHSISRFVMRGADKVFADGSHVKDSLDTLLGQESGAIIRPMGVWTAEFADVPSSVPTPYPNGYVLFVGRFVEKKGITFLLRAIHHLREEFMGLGLVLIGGGPLEHELRLEVRDLGLEDSVTFCGPLPHHEIVRYLHGCRAACVPSIIDSKGETEGMPTIVIEAMAAGACVVASDVDGIPDVVRHRENGWLAQPADAEDLARQLSEALTYSSREAISLEARATALKHDWENVVRQYELALVEAVGDESP